MESILQRELRRRLRDAGISQRALSLAAGLDATAVKAILRGKSKHPRMETIRKLASALPDCRVADLTGETGDSEPRPGLGSIVTKNAIDDRHFAMHDLRVLGTRADEKIGFFELKEQVEMTSRPAKLFGVPQAYSFYVQDDSMSPRYRRGEMCYVNPHRPPHDGDCAIVQFKAIGDAPALSTIVEIVRRTTELLVAKKYMPAEIIEIALSSIVAIHWIVLAGDP